MILKQNLINKELLSDIIQEEVISFKELVQDEDTKFKDNCIIIETDNACYTPSSYALIDFIEKRIIQKGYSIVVGYDLKKKKFKGKVKWLYKCTNVKFCEIEKSSNYIYGNKKLDIYIKNYKWILEQ